jgi:nucleoid DNA-binding protein
MSGEETSSRSVTREQMVLLIRDESGVHSDLVRTVLRAQERVVRGLLESGTESINVYGVGRLETSSRLFKTNGIGGTAKGTMIRRRVIRFRPTPKFRKEMTSWTSTE